MPGRQGRSVSAVPVAHTRTPSRELRRCPLAAEVACMLHSEPIYVLERFKSMECAAQVRQPRSCSLRPRPVLLPRRHTRPDRASHCRRGRPAPGPGRHGQRAHRPGPDHQHIPARQTLPAQSRPAPPPSPAGRPRLGRPRSRPGSLARTQRGPAEVAQDPSDGALPGGQCDDRLSPGGTPARRSPTPATEPASVSP